MPIIRSDPVAQKGKKDAARHREKQKDAIRRQLPEIIARESIITSKKGKIVKVPIRIMDIPHFRPAQGSAGAGVGQGKGKAGGVIGRRPGTGKPGEAGDRPGEEYLETEIEMEELIEMMIEDLGLPRLEERKGEGMVAETRFKIRGIQKTGPWVLLDKRRSAREGLRRFWEFLHYLVKETGRDELACFDALEQTDGILADALELLKSGAYAPIHTVFEPFPIFYPDDLRFLEQKKDIEYHSQAVVFALMDTSGSMTDKKKYLARSALFWLAAFLRTIYERVEIRFIIHDARAEVVEEEEFFKKVLGGGTRAWTAYELAGGLMDSEYPVSEWNIYLWHFSDGEDFEPARAALEAKKLIERGISMFGYGEIEPSSSHSDSALLAAFKEILDVQVHWKEGFMVVAGRDMPFLAVAIQKKEHVHLALREFLDKERWGHATK
ncbi:MAG: DUF444 family protein [Candidatus Niyogibacteria bacterium]|nr:DUF444 family protein [Candidatus Niyogibacteria bacterium]